jgi:small conductance mechanosensitive channel
LLSYPGLPPLAQLPLHPRLIDRLMDAWSDDIVDLLHVRLPKLLLILVMAYLLVRLLKYSTRHMHRLAEQGPLMGPSRSAQLHTMAGVIETAGYGFIGFVTIIHTLQIFGINIGPLLASAGVVGLAVGFGAQTMVHDVINGMLILVENQFNVGETITIAGFTGTVEQMSLRKTVLRGSVDGTQHIVPNNLITTVSNFSREWATIQVNVSVDYREDVDTVLGTLRSVAQEVVALPEYKANAQAQPTVVGLDSFKGSEIIFPVIFRTHAGKQWDVAREFRRRVKMAFEQQHILPGDPLRVFQYPGTASAPSSTAQGTR